MNLLQKIQDQYLAEFAENISFEAFFINVLLVAILTGILRWYYVRFGQALSNRRRFGNNFLPLSLGTLLIIMIVKSSIALSLGLVGALSIVRFRAAIKDPEELTFLFIAIGLGLAGGANEPVLALLAFTLILSLLFLQQKIFGRRPLTHRSGAVFINLQTDLDDLKAIAAVLSDIFPYVELKRMDTLGAGLDLSFLCQAESIDQLAAAREQILRLSPGSQLSIVDQPELMA